MDPSQEWSIANGVQGFPRTSKKKRKLNANDYQHAEEMGAGAHERFVCCQAVCADLENRIKRVEQELMEQKLKKLFQFIEKARWTSKQSPANGASSEEFAPPFQDQIPCAVLLNGANITDHLSFFQQLQSSLRDRCCPLVGLLAAKVCPSVRALIGRLLPQILPESVTSRFNLKSTFSLSILKSWYLDTYPTQSNSARPTDGAGSRPPLVIVFQDFESFDSKVLQDFIFICGRHQADIPIVLVFGVATSMSAVHTLLTIENTALLSLREVAGPTPPEYLDMVVNKILISDDLPFQISGQIFQELMEFFMNQDFSLGGLIKHLKLITLRHYLTTPAALLCPADGSKPDSLLKALSGHQLDDIRATPSYRKAVEVASPKQQVALLSEEAATRRFCGESISALRSHHRDFLWALRVFYRLTNKMPHIPKGRKLWELYIQLLKPNFCQTKEFQTIFKLFRMYSMNDLRQLLETCLDLCKSSGRSAVFDCPLLNRWLQELAKMEEGLTKEPKKAPGSPRKSQKTKLVSNKGSAVSKESALTFSHFRETVFDYLESFFIEKFRHFKTLPLHEAFYFDQLSEFVPLINPEQQTVVEQALRQPGFYLGKESASADDESIGPNLPDISIAYKLCLECGRIINLQDWKEAFVSVLTSASHDQPPKKKSRKKKQSKDLDNQYQARFMQAVSELQLLGFIKQSRHRNQQVTRTFHC